MSRWARGGVTGVIVVAFVAAVPVVQQATAVSNAGVFELDGEAGVDDQANVDEAVDIYDGTTTGAITAHFFDDGGALANDLVFAGGQSKDSNDITSWGWEIGSVLDKNDVTNAFVATYAAPATSGVPGQPVYALGVDRYDNNGSASFGFWLLQDAVTLGTVSGTNRFVDADGAAATHTVGDVLVVVNFQGGAPDIEAYTWQASGLTLEATGVACGPTLLDTVPLCGITNSAPVTAPWPYTPKTGAAGTFPTDSYLEAAVNLQGLLGIERLGCYDTVVVESRSSQQTTATLNDLNIAPLDSCGVSITKRGPAEASAGEVVTYTFDLTNTGVVPLDVDSLVDDVLGDLTSEVASDGCGRIAALATCTVDATWTVDAGAADPGGIVTNTAVVIAAPPNGEGELTAADSHDLQITAPDLTITKTDGAGSAIPGTVVVYDLAYANDGTADATGVVVTETVPAGATFDAAASSVGWSCADGAPPSTTCTFVVGDVASGDGGSVEFAVTVVSSSTGTLANTASVADDGSNGADLTPGDNVAADTDTLTPVADLGVSIVDAPDPVVAGEQLVYTLSVSNTGPSDAAGVELVHNLPSGAVGFVSVVPSSGCGESGGVVTCSLGGLAVGEDTDVVVTVDVDVAQTSDLSADATVSASTADPVAGNDTAAATTTVLVDAVPEGAVSGRVWHDVDADGVPDAAEPDIAGVRVDLVGAGPDDEFGTADDTTHAPAFTASPYRFDELVPGRYRVTVDPATLPGDLRTSTTGLGGGSPVEVSVGAGASSADVNFGFVNLVPIALDDVVTTDEGVAATVDVLANDTDPEGRPLAVTVVVQPAGGSAVVAPDGSVVYTPGPGFDGDEAFTYVACDPAGECGVATVRVTVDDTNQPPFLTTSTLTFRAGSGGVALPAVDRENDLPIEAAVVSGTVPTGVTLATDGRFGGDPTQFGTFSLVVRLCDARGACADYPLSLRTSGVTIPPTGASSYLLAVVSAMLVLAGLLLTIAARLGGTATSWRRARRA